jgi:hypothetical protein
LLVGEEPPAIANIPVGFPITLDVSSVTDYDIRHFDNWFTEFLFNSSSMVTGQRIAIGGSLNANQNFVPARIVLRRPGVVADLVLNSVTVVSRNQGSFQLQNNALFGYLTGGPLTVQTGDGTLFLKVSKRHSIWREHEAHSRGAAAERSEFRECADVGARGSRATVTGGGTSTEGRQPRPSHRAYSADRAKLSSGGSEYQHSHFRKTYRHGQLRRALFRLG